MAVKFRDYYEVLGVPRDASKEDIRKAFRKLARTHHPDVATEKAGAEERFKEINEAYEVLGDEEKRKKYDAFGEHWKHGEGFTPPPGSGGFQGSWEGGDMGDAYHFEGTGFSDFFENFFGSHAGRGGFTRRGAAAGGGSRPRRGRDIESEILVTLDEVMSGAERTLVIQPRHHGHTEERRTVTIRIPKGVAEGQMIRAAGLGEPGSAGGEAGDLFLHVRLERHPDYRVAEHDLYLDLPLAPWEAVLGATVPVRTPHGETRIKVPAGTEPGTELRLSGKGLPKGKSGEFGHLFAVVRIVMPATVNDEEKRHWQALADLSKSNRARP
jgi:curved DNA-binding protein